MHSANIKKQNLQEDTSHTTGNLRNCSNTNKPIFNSLLTANDFIILKCGVPIKEGRG